ncbi:MAG: hypothetical protein J1D87_04180 [Lachnospiraceae bacterium]|nr:hypothetical protein [Lachnospiraceae bacterium]
MKEKMYKTTSFDKEHRLFGGIIYPSDFNTEYIGKRNVHGSKIASRIESDIRKEYDRIKREV